MTFLDKQFEQFHTLPSEEKSERFKMGGHLFDMIFSQQLSREIIDHIYKVTNALRFIHKSKEGADYLQTVLSNKRAMLYFVQPSSRTFLSFQNACYMLGMTVSEIRDANVSSEVKGESFDDSLRTFSSYSDIIIMRHRVHNVAERAAWLLNTYSNRAVPVINGGSGSDQHPTQAILDIYTLQRSFEKVGGLDNKTILMCGDLKRGRTVRSLSYLMKNFEGMKLIFVAPSHFQMADDVLDFLTKNNIPFEIETESLNKVLPMADAVYMCRIQDEHDVVYGESGKIDISNFKLKLEDMPKVKSTAAILSLAGMKLMWLLIPIAGQNIGDKNGMVCGRVRH